MGWLNQFNKQARQCCQLQGKPVAWKESGFGSQDSRSLSENIIAATKILSHAGAVNKDVLDGQAMRNAAVLERAVDQCRKKIISERAVFLEYRRTLERAGLQESTMHKKQQPLGRDWFKQADTLIINENTGQESYGNWKDVKNTL